jgi:O-antigen ligase
MDVAIQYFTGKDLFGYRADEINGFPIGQPLETWNDRILQRFAGPFGFDKRAGIFILFFGVVGYFLNNNLNKNKNFYYLIFFFSIFVTSIIITGDRAPLVILFILFVLIIIFENNIRKKVILFFSILLLIFSLMFFFSKNTKYRFFTNVVEYSNTQKSYINSISEIKKIIIDNPWTAHYLTAFEIFKDSPIFGKGIRSFRYECEKYPDIKSSYASSRCSTHPHNLFFEILSEVGIVGLIFFILLFYEFMKIKKISYSNNIIFYLLIALILPIKPTGALFSTWFGSLLWLLMGFYYWEINKKKIN